MYKKILYLLIIFVASLVLFNYLSAQTKYNIRPGALLNSEFLINRQTTDPKRLFLKTWRIVKSKYYDPTLNGQDWMRWNRHYIDRIKTKEDAYVAINSMLASLDDPYSKFLDEKEYLEQTTNIDAKIVGIGVNIISTSGKVIIISVVEGTPAAQKGLKAGDIIMKVDGANVAGKSVSDVASVIRGEEGKSVTLEILRGKNKLTAVIPREEIKIKNIKAEVLDQNIGYIQISSFISSDLSTEFIEALTKTEKCPGLIIDLRGNAGGLMPNAIFIADMFLPEGHIVSMLTEIIRNRILTPKQSPMQSQNPWFCSLTKPAQAPRKS